MLSFVKVNGVVASVVAVLFLHCVHIKKFLHFFFQEYIPQCGYIILKHACNSLVKTSSIRLQEYLVFSP